jgi:hypothetical protein
MKLTSLLSQNYLECAGVLVQRIVFRGWVESRGRSHMEREHLPPIREVPEEVKTLKLEQVEVKSYVGGLVRSFERKAA